MPTLRFEQFRVQIGSETIYTLNTTLGPGQCLTLMGPSGLGKSTALLAMAGFAPDWAKVSGALYLDEARVDGLPPEDRKLGLLFQDDLLFPHLTVAGNLLFALEAVGTRAERRSKVEQALEEAGLAGLADRAPATLSGGQRSRVSLLRTLVSAPRALLLDEPFARLDLKARAQMRMIVLTEARKRGLPVVLVTHELADADAFGGTMLTLPEA